MENVTGLCFEITILRPVVDALFGGQVRNKFAYFRLDTNVGARIL